MKKKLQVTLIMMVLFFSSGFQITALPEKPPNNPQSVVEQLYQNINKKEFRKNRDLFMYLGADIIAYEKGNGMNNENKRSAAEWIDWQYSEKQWNHYIDNIEVKYASNSLCIIILKGHTGTWRVDFSSIFILSKKYSDWKIISMTQENK